MPMGDFSVIAELPGMYKCCKATEDKDLNVLEFFTEHVSGMGQLLEGIEHDEEQDEANDKPHIPVQFHFQQMQLVCIASDVKTSATYPVHQLIIPIPVEEKMYRADYISNIFRPPIA